LKRPSHKSIARRRNGRGAAVGMTKRKKEKKKKNDGGEVEEYSWGGLGTRGGSQ
jgi:hypothetical protein